MAPNTAGSSTEAIEINDKSKRNNYEFKGFGELQ